MAYSKRRRRLSKFQLSQRAHYRSFKKNSKLNCKKAYILEHYHDNCYLIQKMKKRILTKSERKKLFDRATAYHSTHSY